MKTKMLGSANDAVDFLLTRIAEQARTDSVSISDVELKQLSFSEQTASPEEMAAVEEFDNTNDASEFEAKIAKLLHRAFKHDVGSGKKDVWQGHLAALRDRDIYVLVMVDQAGIPRPKPSFLTTTTAIFPRGVLQLVQFLFCAVVGLAGLLYFFVLPMRSQRGSAPVFGDLSRFKLSDSMAGLFFVAWLASLFLLGKQMTRKT